MDEDPFVAFNAVLDELRLSNREAGRLAGIGHRSVRRAREGDSPVSPTALRLFLAIKRDPTLIPFLTEMAVEESEAVD